MLCVISAQVVAGDVVGRLVVFTSGVLTAVQTTPHDTAITAMCNAGDRKFITASQNFVAVWTHELQQLQVHALAGLHPTPAMNASPITARVDGTGYRLLLGFDSSQLYELTLDFR